MMKASELRNRSVEELKSELLDLRKEQFNLRIQRSTSQLGNSSRFKEVQKDIARIKTVMNEIAEK